MFLQIVDLFILSENDWWPCPIHVIDHTKELAQVMLLINSPCPQLMMITLCQGYPCLIKNRRTDFIHIPITGWTSCAPNNKKCLLDSLLKITRKKHQNYASHAPCDRNPPVVPLKKGQWCETWFHVLTSSYAGRGQLEQSIISYRPQAASMWSLYIPYP